MQTNKIIKGTIEILPIGLVLVNYLVLFGRNTYNRFYIKNVKGFIRCLNVQKKSLNEPYIKYI